MSSSCCGQGMTNLMSQFKMTTSQILPHPHGSSNKQTIQQTIQTTQPIIQQQLQQQNFTRRGFTKFTRPNNN
jgi:hypothetical protein